MKRILTTIVAALICVAAHAAAPQLSFGKQGEFRIAQFTDMHIDLGTDNGREQALKTLAQMDDMLATQQIDLVVFTGDIVTGKPATQGWNAVLDVVKKYNTPFCVVLGNHDYEQDITRAQIAQIVTAYPQSLNLVGVNGQLADVVLKISNGKSTTAAIYCLDSNDYSTIKGLDGYGWFRHEQVEWFRTQSAALTAQNGGKTLPALAFFHIALPEYVAAWRNKKNSHIGRAAEDECPGVLNTGMFSAMRQAGDVMGTFVGHDHDIDYVVAEHGIALGYGRFSGDRTTYTNLLPGVRILTLKSGERGFQTWIRERDGRVVDHVQFKEGKISKVK